MMEMQCVLGLGIGSNITKIVSWHPNLNKVSTGLWSRLCGLVYAYRLVDVIALLKNWTPNELQVLCRPFQSQKTLYVSIPAYLCILIVNF